jgi:hypothetical protein
MTTEQLQELAEHLDYVEIHAGMIRQHLETVGNFKDKEIRIRYQL